MPPGQGRKTAIRLVLAPTERDRLAALLRATDTPAPLARRARLLLLVADGLPLSHIATRVGIGRHKIAPWVRRYQAHGLAGLADRRASGTRPPPAPHLLHGLTPGMYAVGTRVYWGGDPAQPWRVRWQRITYYPVGGPLIEYAIGTDDNTDTWPGWVDAAGVVPWEERPSTLEDKGTA